MRKGQKHTKEAKEKNRLAHIGKIFSMETRRKLSLAHMGEKNHFYGKQHSEKTRKKMSELKQGEKHNFYGVPRSKETRRKIGKGNAVALLGKILPTEVRMKIADAHRGPKSHLWKGGITPLNEHIRTIFEYKLWRTRVFERDDFTCQDCGQRGGRLNADHIKPFSVILSENNIMKLQEAISCKELWDINNGNTLCEKCHRATPTFASKVKNYKLLELNK